MSAVLTTREATVHTMAVHIAVLKVGTKHVTMGLFRQLPLGVLLDPETLQLRGVPWGHVQYFWEGDGRFRDASGHESVYYYSGAHLHVVWQDGETLRRAFVYSKPDQNAVMRLASADAELATYKANHAAQWQALSALPQLFIAV